MNIISFFNAKGGTGKTSLCYLSGLHLSTMGERVLLIDLDPQSSLSQYINPDYELSIFDFFTGRTNLNDCIIRKPLNYTFDIIPSSLHLQKLYAGINQNTLSKAFQSLDYELILIDCPPYLASFTISALQASDSLFIPYLASKADIDSAYFTIDEAIDIKPKIDINTVLNRYRKTQREDYYKEEAFKSFKTTNLLFPQLSGIPAFLDTKDSLELKRNEKIKEAIEVFSHTLTTKAVIL